MKRLISFVLCAAMLVGMVATAVGAAWGDTGVGATITTSDEATYASNGSAYTFAHATTALIYEHRDLNKSTSTTLVNQVGNIDFTWYNGVYFSSASETEGYFGVGFWISGNDAAGLALRYDFSRNLFYIQTNAGMGWSSAYNADYVVASASYDLPTDQWMNLGFHVSNSKAEILLNGEVVCSADVGYTSGSYCYLYCNQVEGYWDNHRFEHVANSYCSSTYHTFVSQYDNILWDWDTATANGGSPHAHVQLLGSSYTSSAPAGSCGMQWTRDLISAAYNVGTGVTEAQLIAANNAWNALSPSQKSTLANEGYNHLIAKANAYYYATNSSDAANAKSLINAIGTVSYPGSATAISNARSAYDAVMAYSYDTGYNNDVTESWIDSALSDVMSSYASTLEAAEARYAELEVAQGEAAQNQAAADAVIAKINAIGTVTYTDVSKGKIDDARTAYNALTDAQKALVSNYTTLTAAETTYANLKAEADANQAAADAVIAKINSIGTVSYPASETVINDARTAYDALTPAQKALVTNAGTLTTAEARFAELKAAAEQAAADQAAADAVISKINAIGEVSYTNLSKIMITDARTAYDNLTAAQQSLVSNYSVLTDAESKYSALEKAANDQIAADSVIDMINALPSADALTLDNSDAVTAARTAFIGLTADQQSLVTNIGTLEVAEARIAELSDAKADADAVIAQINALGEITLESGDAITAAENAYAALSDEAKGFVTNYDTLTAARSSYNSLLVSDFNTRATNELKDVSIANKADLQALLNEYNELKVAGLNVSITTFSRLNSAISTIERYESAVQNVEDLISAISTPVTLDSLADIEAAEAAYDALTTQEQKDLVENYQVLLDARAAYDELLNQDDVSALNKVKATSLVISDTLAVNYKIQVADGYEIVKMNFTLAGVTTTVSDYTVEADTGYLVFRFDNIAPDLMGETIESVIVVKDGNGTEYTCDPASYSIAAYANNKIATAGLTELLASMINYGDAAVAYTGTYTAPSALIDNWVNYTDDITAARDYTSVQAIGTELAAPSVTWGSASLILSDSVDICIKLSENVGDGYYAKTFYGEEFTFDVVTENGVSYFVWDLYNAAQMSNSCAVSFVIYDAQGNAVSNSLTYSVESYVADMLASSESTDALKTLLTSMMQYGDAALAYKTAANG